MLGILGFFIVRVYRRRMVLKKLVSLRLEPEELKAQLDAGEQVYIVDLRHPLELMAEPFTLPSAMHFSPDSLTARQGRFPGSGCGAVLYLPKRSDGGEDGNDVAQAGIEAGAAAAGRDDEWKRLGFPLDEIPPVNPLVQVGAGSALMPDWQARFM